MEGKNLSKTYWLLFDTDCRIQACVMVLNYKCESVVDIDSFVLKN